MAPRFLLPRPIWANILSVKPKPDRYWVVPDFLERGDRLIVTGGEGEGKSTLLRQWAIMIASGIHPFTLQPMDRQRVMLLDLENSEEQIKDEINKICERAEIEVPGQPWLAITPWPAGIDLRSPDYEEAVRSILTEFPPDILMGGPMYKMLDSSLADEEGSKQLASALDRMRVDFDCCQVWEAHQINEAVAFDNAKHEWARTRAARPFGSSLWRRWPEFGFCLFSNGTLFHWRTGRQRRDWPHRLQRDGGTWLWQPDNGMCPVCLLPRPEGKEVYCSDKCKQTAKMRRYRQGKVEVVD